jgi:hypothetical protein
VYVIFDSSYREIARFGAANGYNGDHHVFLISPQDTALITIYNGVPKELSSIGGTKDGLAVQGIVQELDIETGRLLFEWKSLEHVGLDESYGKPGEDLDYPGIDYFHIYSIDVDHDDNLLISARDGQNEIYTISLSGGTWGNPTRLTFNAKSDKTPAFSPNGKKIVWERGEYLYLMNADGTSQHKIPNTFHSNYEIGRYGSFGGNPAFSRNLPGGNKIIVVRDPSSPSLKGRLHGRPSKYIGYWASGCQGW